MTNSNDMYESASFYDDESDEATIRQGMNLAACCLSVLAQRHPSTEIVITREEWEKAKKDHVDKRFALKILEDENEIRISLT